MKTASMTVIFGLLQNIECFAQEEEDAQVISNYWREKNILVLKKQTLCNSDPYLQAMHSQRRNFEISPFRFQKSNFFLLSFGEYQYQQRPFICISPQIISKYVVKNTSKSYVLVRIWSMFTPKRFSRQQKCSYY